MPTVTTVVSSNQDLQVQRPTNIRVTKSDVLLGSADCPVTRRQFAEEADNPGHGTEGAECGTGLDLSTKRGRPPDERREAGSTRGAR